MMVYEDNIVKMKCKTCKTPIAKVIDIDYNEFECNEINFHTPSEHTINGQSFPMVTY
jgi:carbonic anhydrase